MSFAPRNGASSSTPQTARQHAFQQLKPICSQLLPRSPLSVATVHDVVVNLRRLLAVLASLDEQTVASLAEYISFPLFQLLRVNSLANFGNHESALEGCMAVLASLVGPWRRSPRGMQADLAQQLWLVCVLILGGDLDAGAGGKGKERKVECSEETVAASLQVLLALLEPIESSMDEPSPPATILAHTLTALLDLIAENSEMESRLLSCRCLLHLVSRHLAVRRHEDAPMLVQFFPGLVSTLAKILAPPRQLKVKQRSLPSALLVEALAVLGHALLSVIGNAACADLLKDSDGGRIEALEELVTSPQVPPPVERDKDASSSGRRSAAWLTATTSQLHVAFVSFAFAMRDHHTPAVRSAYASMAGCLVEDCSRTADERSRRVALADLLILSCDEQPEVAKSAIDQLSRLDASNRMPLEILLDTLQGLPQTIMSFGDDEAKLLRIAALIRGAAQALVEAPGGQLAQELTRASRKWSLALLQALELAAISPAQGNRSTAVAAAFIAPPSSLNSSEADPSWPDLPLKRVSSRTAARALRQALLDLAETSLGPQRNLPPVLLEHYLSLTASGLPIQQRVAAWWMLEVTLETLSPVPGSLQSAPAKYRKAARSVIRRVLELGEEDLQQGFEAGTQAAGDGERTLVAIERHRGSTELSTRLDSFSGTGASQAGAAEARRREVESCRIAILSLSLRCLAAAAAVLGTAFRSELISTLYVVLAHLGPLAHPVLRSHAEVALELIASRTGYASTANLVLDNVDYVVNAVSQRLKLPRLDPQAPLVLITLIRLAGQEIVPLVRDAVDDVFDALDDFHEYGGLCASLLAVLDALLRTMAEDLPVEVEPTPSVAHPEQPYVERELADLATWLAQRRHKVEEPREDFGPVPQKSWATEVLDEMDTAEEGQEQPSAAEEDEEPPLSRAQAVCAAMLEKALLFLSHDSEQLRARVLSLMAAGVPVLAERRPVLLPIIHKAWPYILNRLSETESPPVVAEAAALVEALGRHVGDYMTRRVVDDAWPRFKALLHSMDKRQSSVAYVDRYSSTTRTRLAIVGAMIDVCRGVALQDDLAWELARDMRLLLRTSVEESVRGKTKDLLVQLQEHHPERVWLALAGGLGEAGLPSFLRVEGLDVALVQGIL